MALTGVNNHYSNVYREAPAAQKNETSGKAKESKDTDTAKAGYKNQAEYTKYLKGKYSFLNAGTVSMEGVPTTVTVSPAFLEKCRKDPEKARYLEENLADIPNCNKKLVAGCPDTVTNITHNIDANGDISQTMSGTTDPDGKIAKENAARKAREKKAEEEKAAKKRKEKQAAEEKSAEENNAARMARSKELYSLTARGTDVKSATESLIGKANSSSPAASAAAEGMTGIDLRA